MKNTYSRQTTRATNFSVAHQPGNTGNTNPQTRTNTHEKRCPHPRQRPATPTRRSHKVRSVARVAAPLRSRARATLLADPKTNRRRAALREVARAPYPNPKGDLPVKFLNGDVPELILSPEGVPLMYPCALCGAMGLGVAPHGWGSPCPAKLAIDAAYIDSLEASAEAHRGSGMSANDMGAVFRKLLGDMGEEEAA